MTFQPQLGSISPHHAEYSWVARVQLLWPQPQRFDAAAITLRLGAGMESMNASVLNMSIGCSRGGDLTFIESTWPADLDAEGPEHGLAAGHPRLLPMSRVRGPMRTALLAQGALTPEDLVDPEEGLEEEIDARSAESRGVARLLLLMPSGDGYRTMQPRHFDGCGPRLRWMEPSSQRAEHASLRLSPRRASARACPAVGAFGSAVAALRAARAMREDAYTPSLAALQAGEGSLALTMDLSYQAKAEQMMNAFADDVAKVRARFSHRSNSDPSCPPIAMC